MNNNEQTKALPTKHGYVYFTFRDTKLDMGWIAVNNKTGSVTEHENFN